MKKCFVKNGNGYLHTFRAVLCIFYQTLKHGLGRDPLSNQAQLPRVIPYDGPSLHSSALSISALKLAIKDLRRGTKVITFTHMIPFALRLR